MTREEANRCFEQVAGLDDMESAHLVSTGPSGDGGWGVKVKRRGSSLAEVATGEVDDAGHPVMRPATAAETVASGYVTYRFMEDFLRDLEPLIGAH